MTSPVRAPRPTPRRSTLPQELPPLPRDRRSHLRVVPPPARPQRHQRRSGAVVVVAALLVFGSLLTSAVLHGLLVSGQATIDRLDADLQDGRTALAQEKLELANLQAPARIAAEAELLGMVPADGQHWLSPGTGDAPVITGTAPLGSTDADADPDTEADLPGGGSVDGSELAAAPGGTTR